MYSSMAAFEWRAIILKPKTVTAFQSADDHRMACGTRSRAQRAPWYYFSMNPLFAMTITSLLIACWPSMRCVPSVHQYGYCMPYRSCVIGQPRSFLGSAQKIANATTSTSTHVQQNVKVLTITSGQYGHAHTHTHTTLIFARNEWHQSNQIGGGTINGLEPNKIATIMETTLTQNGKCAAL